MIKILQRFFGPATRSSRNTEKNSQSKDSSMLTEEHLSCSTNPTPVMTAAELVTSPKDAKSAKYRIVGTVANWTPQYRSQYGWVNFTGIYPSREKAEDRIKRHYRHTAPKPPSPKPKVIKEYYVTEEGLKHIDTDYEA